MAFERQETRLFIEPVNILDGTVPFDFTRAYDDDKPSSEWIINEDEVILEFPPNMEEIYAAYQEEPKAFRTSTAVAGIGAVIAGVGIGAVAGGVIGDVISGDLGAAIGTVGGAVAGGVTGLLIATDISAINVSESYPLPFRFSLITTKPHYNSAYEYLFDVTSRLLQSNLISGIDKKSAKDFLFTGKNSGKLETLAKAYVPSQNQFKIENDVGNNISEKIVRVANQINEKETIVYKNVKIDEEEMQKWNMRAYIRCQSDENLFINEDGNSSNEKIIEMTPVTVSTFSAKPSDYGLTVRIRSNGTGFLTGLLGALGGAVIGAAVGAGAVIIGGEVAKSISSGKSFSIKNVGSSLISAAEDVTTDVVIGAVVGAAVGAVAGGIIGAIAGRWEDASDDIMQLVRIDFLEYIPSQLATAETSSVGGIFGAGTEVKVNDDFEFDEAGKWCKFNDALLNSLRTNEYRKTGAKYLFEDQFEGDDVQYPHMIFRYPGFKMHAQEGREEVFLDFDQYEIIKPKATFECKFNYVPVQLGNSFIDNQQERVRYQRWLSRHNDVISGFPGTDRIHYERRQQLTDDYLIQGTSIDDQAVLKGMEFDETFSSVPERLQKGLPLQVDMRLENTPQSISACFVDCYIDGEKVAALSPFPPKEFTDSVSEFFRGVGLGTVVDVVGAAGDLVGIPEGVGEYTEYWRGFIPAEKLNDEKKVRVKFVATFGAARVESETYSCEIINNVVMGEAYERVWTEYNEWQLDNRNRFPLAVNPEYGVGDTFRDRFEDAIKFVEAGTNLIDIVPPGRAVNMRANVSEHYIDIFWDAPVAPDTQFIQPEEVTIDNLGDLLEDAAKKVASEAAGLFEVPEGQSTIGVLGALDIAEFRVYRKSQYDIKWRQVASVDETRYRASGLEPGIKYEFYVETVDAQGNSSLILDGLFFGLTRGVDGLHFEMLNNEYGKYVVKAGESYASIAGKFDIEEAKLKQANLAGGGPVPISEGQTINLVRKHLFLKLREVEISEIDNTEIVIQ